MFKAVYEEIASVVRGLLLGVIAAFLSVAAFNRFGAFFRWWANHSPAGPPPSVVKPSFETETNGVQFTPSAGLEVPCNSAAGHRAASPTQLLRRTIRSGVSTVRRIAYPFLRVKIELNRSAGVGRDTMNASVFGSTGAGLDTHGSCGLCSGTDSGEPGAPLTPLTAQHFSAAKTQRAIANACIRQSLVKVVPEEIAASLKVNACSWNVDQRPPPEYSVSFLTWMLGVTLAEKVNQYHVDRQRIMSANATPSVSPSPSRVPAESTTSNKQRPSQEQHARRIAASDAHLNHLLTCFPDLLIITLQEVDMGGVALVKESTLSSTAWTEAILETLHLAADRQLFYRRLKVVQLVGLVLIVLVQAQHVDYISHVRLSLTRTGAMRVLGNKGSVAMRATIYGKRFLFIAAHFAAHKYNEERRMNNYHAALNDLHFDMPAFTDDESEVLRTFVNANESTASMIESFVKGRSAWDRLFRVFDRPVSMDAESRVLDQHDYIFFLGDLNSRLHAVDSADIRAHIAKNDFDALLIHDELRQGMVYGDVFDGFEEQWIHFPPTYKFDKGTSTYDTSRKKRDPAWCDRVLFRVLDPNGGTQSSPLPPVDVTACTSNPMGEVGESTGTVTGGVGPSWVTLSDIEKLGKEGGQTGSMNANTVTGGRSAASTVSHGSESSSTSTSTTESLLTASATDSAVGGGGWPLTSPQPASSATNCKGTNVSTPAASLLLSDVEHAGPGDIAPSASSARANLRVGPTPYVHHVWKQRSGDETFKAARRPVDPRALEDLRFPMVPNRINALEYFCVADLKQSDHRPICARFEAKVIVMKPDLVSSLLADIQEHMEKDGAQAPSAEAAPNASPPPPPTTVSTLTKAMNAQKEDALIVTTDHEAGHSAPARGKVSLKRVASKPGTADGMTRRSVASARPAAPAGAMKAKKSPTCVCVPASTSTEATPARETNS